MNEQAIELEKKSAELNVFLQEKGLSFRMVAVGRKGGQANIEDFMPDGWEARIVVVPVVNRNDTNHTG